MWSPINKRYVTGTWSNNRNSSQTKELIKNKSNGNLDAMTIWEWKYTIKATKELRETRH